MAVHNNTVSESERRKKEGRALWTSLQFPPLIFPQHFQRKIRLERVVLFSNSLYSHWVKGEEERVGAGCGGWGEAREEWGGGRKGEGMGGGGG